MSHLSRYTIAAVCVIATYLPSWWLERRAKIDATGAAQFDAARLPLQIGNWLGTDTDVDERLVRHVGSVGGFVNRSYDNGALRRVMVHMAAFPTAHVSMPHPPPLCYRNAGWTIESDVWVRDGGSQPYRLMIVEREGERVAVAYWYQLSRFVVADRAELRDALQTLRSIGEPWPPLVKVLMQVAVVTSEQDARESIEQLGPAIFDWVRTQP
jgi:hypothetical protein